ncbi:unnamed protein product [Orchesella dallaii]|uniref:C2H2-type domain-containing protein n=1 Tax=Orchesella dallaii TaxID=48710 RepID=A0ABP1PV63_9HEXA
MSSQSGKRTWRLEDVAVWFRCNQCQGYFHSFPTLESHFLEQHHGKEFIVPKNLPAEAREGRVYMRKSKQQLLQSERKSAPLQQELAGSSKIGRNEEERFKHGSALNLQLKATHENTKSSSEEVIKINKKTGTACVTSPSDPNHQLTVISTHADSATQCLPARENETPTTSVLNQQKNTQRGAPSEILLDPKYIVHLGRKNRQCPKCPYFTYTEVRYMAHLKLHKNSGAHKCRHCGAYLTLKGMYPHVAKMHPNAVRQDNIPVNQETSNVSNLEGSKIVTCKTFQTGFATVNNMPQVGYMGIGKDRICGFDTNFEKRDEGAKPHRTNEDKILRTTSGLCSLSHEAYEMLHINKGLLRSLEGLHVSQPKKERFSREINATESRTERAALAEPLGTLLEFITENPSAATFREVTAHVNYIEQFTKRLLNTQAQSSTNYIKFVDAVSKTTKDTVIGFNRIQEEMKEVRSSFNYLQKKYDYDDLALHYTNLVLGDSLQKQYGILTRLWFEQKDST